MKNTEKYYAILYERLTYDKRYIKTEIDYSSILEKIFTNKIDAISHIEKISNDSKEKRLFTDQIICLIGKTHNNEFYDRYTVFEIYK